MRKTSFLFLLSLLLLCACGKRERMEDLLCKAEQMNQKYLPLNSVTFMDEVLDYYEAHGNREERQRANYIMGSIHRDCGNSPMALQYFLQAANLADTTRPDCDFQKLNRIYAQMALIFHQQRYPQKELEMWQRAASMAEKAGDSVLYYQSIERLGGAYRLMGDSAEGFNKLRNACNGFVRLGKRNKAAASLASIALYYLRKDSLTKAKQALDEYMGESGLYDRKTDSVKPRKEFFFYCLGLYYEKSKNLDSALWYYNKLACYPNLNNLENAYKGLMSTYLRLGKADSVAKYARLYADANDTASLRHSADEVSRVQALYDYSDFQRQAFEKKEEAKNLQITLFTGICLALAAAFIVICFIRTQRKKSRQALEESNAMLSLYVERYKQTSRDLSQFKADKSEFEQTKLDEIATLKQIISTYQGNDINGSWTNEKQLLCHPIVTQIRQKAKKGETLSQISH